MLYVESNGTIRLTRGDSARFKVTIQQPDENDEYIIQPGDTLRMTVKKSTDDTHSLVRKVVVGASTFYFEPTDTEHLAYGKYKYDVELTTESGDVYTVIEPTTFELLQEVTW